MPRVFTAVRGDWRSRAPFALAALFLVNGVVHLVRPEFYAPIVPHQLPEPLTIVRLSGIAELVCAAGLLTGRRWAGPASALLLLAVFPANVQHAINVVGDPRSASWSVAAVVARLPLQVPLVWAALRARRN